jgi:hypothetical protein
MRRADLLPDRYTYNALLRGIAAARDLEDTQRVVRPTAPHVLTGAPFVAPFLLDFLVHFVYQRGSGSSHDHWSRSLPSCAWTPKPCFGQDRRGGPL